MDIDLCDVCLCGLAIPQRIHELNRFGEVQRVFQVPIAQRIADCLLHDLARIYRRSQLNRTNHFFIQLRPIRHGVYIEDMSGYLINRKNDILQFRDRIIRQRKR